MSMNHVVDDTMERVMYVSCGPVHGSWSLCMEDTGEWHV